MPEQKPMPHGYSICQKNEATRSTQRKTTRRKNSPTELTYEGHQGSPRKNEKKISAFTTSQSPLHNEPLHVSINIWGRGVSSFHHVLILSPIINLLHLISIT